MQLIEHIEVGSGGAASITFSAIPAAFTDLVVVLSGRTASTGDDAITIQFNNSTSNYSMRRLAGNGSSASSDSGTANIRAGVSTNFHTSNTFGSWQAYVPNYRSSAFKSVSLDAVAETNGTTVEGQQIVAGLWSDTSAITIVKLTPLSATNFLQHSSASLFGITAGSDGIVAVS